MAGELPDSKGLMREIKALGLHVSELESELREAKWGLAESQRRQEERENDFRILMEFLPEMVSRHHPDSTYVYVSPACQRLFGYTSEDLLGRKAFDYMHPDDRARVIGVTQEAVATGGSNVAEYRHLTKAGTYGLFSVRERLRDLNATLDIVSNPGAGTRVTVTAPLRCSAPSPEGDVA